MTCFEFAFRVSKRSFFVVLGDIQGLQSKENFLGKEEVVDEA